MSAVSDFLAGVKTTVKNTENVFKAAITTNDIKDISGMFKDVQVGAGAVIDTVIKIAPKKPGVMPPPSSNPLVTGGAAGVAKQPDYTIALSIAAVVGLLILFRKA